MNMRHGGRLVERRESRGRSFEGAAMRCQDSPADAVQRAGNEKRMSGCTGAPVLGHAHQKASSAASEPGGNMGRARVRFGPHSKGRAGKFGHSARFLAGCSQSPA